jgi:twinkle protein
MKRGALTVPEEMAAVDPEALVLQALRLYRGGGLKRGDSTGWKNVDELYTVAVDQFTVITGVPGSGKSEWLDALLVNLAEGGGWEFCLYSPETFPTETHLIKLAEKHVRKPFTGQGRMTEQEFLDASGWINERFYWIEPTLKTPETLIAHALHYRAADKKLGIVLDPWNVLEHRRGGMSETDYISFVLTELIHQFRGLNAHLFLVVHPKKMDRNKDGTRPVPTPYDLAGSAHFYNKSDNILTVHRDQTDPDSQRVEIHVQKVKRKWIGRVGLAELLWFRDTGRYMEAPPKVVDIATGKRERYA